MTTVYSQSLKNSEHLRDEWETKVSSSPFTTTAQSHKEQESLSASPNKAEPLSCTTVMYDTGKTHNSKGFSRDRNTYSHSEKQTRLSTTPQVVGFDPESGGNDNNLFPVLDSNTIYILGAIGGALVVIMFTILLLGIVCICRARQKKTEAGGLKRSNTTRSSNASDFVFNSAYEWTCRQTRLLDHLRPDTTGYQSHWSLTRDVSKKRPSLQRNGSTHKEPSVSPPPPETPGKSDTTQCAATTTTSKDSSDAIAGKVSYSEETEYEAVSMTVNSGNACVVIENELQCEENADRVEHKPHKRDHDDTDSEGESIPHTKLTKRDSEAATVVGVQLSYLNQCNGSAVDMYSNPLYARRERDKRRRESRRCERESRKRKLEEEEEEGGERERRRERWSESENHREENDSIPRKNRSTASFFITPLEPLSSFLLSDSETYDSGNASAVSTDIASIQLSTNQDAATSRGPTDSHRQQQLLAADEGGLVESNSFEFSNNIGHNP